MEPFFAVAYGLPDVKEIHLSRINIPLLKQGWDHEKYASQKEPNLCDMPSISFNEYPTTLL